MSEENFRKLIKNLIQQNGCKIEGYDTEDRVRISRNGDQGLLYLDNLRRQYKSGSSEAELGKTLQTLFTEPKLPPAWSAAKDLLFLQLQGDDFVAETCIKRPVCIGLQQFVVYSSADGAQLTLVTDQQIKDWAVTNDLAFAQAKSNMDQLLIKAKLGLIKSDVKDNLGYFELDSNLKASLIMSSKLKDIVKDKLGWPVYVAIPCADFIYITADKKLASRMGATISKEYRNSPQPLSREIFLISDQGIKPCDELGK
ncbi:hypothetical protein BH11CYA1_BH11CYA1_43990 [soil metagenome]